MLQRFKQWLAPTTYTSRYEDAQSLRTPSSSQWIFDDPTYKKWLSIHDSSALLWIHGELLYSFLTTKHTATHCTIVRKTWCWENCLGSHSCRASQGCGCKSVLLLLRLSSIIRPGAVWMHTLRSCRKFSTRIHRVRRFWISSTSQSSLPQMASLQQRSKKRPNFLSSVFSSLSLRV